MSHLKESNQELSIEFNQLKGKLVDISNGKDFIKQLNFLLNADRCPSFK